MVQGDFSFIRYHPEKNIDRYASNAHRTSEILVSGNTTPAIRKRAAEIIGGAHAENALRCIASARDCSLLIVMPVTVAAMHR